MIPLNEGSSPWMNEEFIKSINLEDFNMGFEVEFCKDVSDYEIPDEYYDFDENAFNEDSLNIEDEIKSNINAFSQIKNIGVLFEEDMFNEWYKYENETDKFIDSAYLINNKEYFIKFFNNNFSTLSPLFETFYTEFEENDIDEDEESELLEEIGDQDLTDTWENNGWDNVATLKLISENYPQYISSTKNTKFKKYIELLAMADEVGEKLKDQLHDIARQEVDEKVKEEFDDETKDLRSKFIEDNFKGNESDILDSDAVQDVAARLSDTDIADGQVHEYYNYENTGDEWAVKLDTSVYGFHRNLYKEYEETRLEYEVRDPGLEISTPVFVLDEGLVKLKDIFEFIDDYYYTNDKCGLHISIDKIDSNKDKENWLKIAVLFNDKYFSKQFGRENNSNNKSLFEFFKNISEEDKKKIINGSEINYSYIEKLFKNNALSSHDERYHAINFENDNYYEFRLQGGEDYQNMYPRIRNNILHFAAIVQVASSDIFDKEYKQKLKSLLFRDEESLNKSSESNLTQLTKTLEGNSSERIRNRINFLKKLLSQYSSTRTINYPALSILKKNISSPHELGNYLSYGLEIPKKILETLFDKQTIQNDVVHILQQNRYKQFFKNFYLKFLPDIKVNELNSEEKAETIYGILYANNYDQLKQPEISLFLKNNENEIRNIMKDPTSPKYAVDKFEEAFKIANI